MQRRRHQPELPAGVVVLYHGSKTPEHGLYTIGARCLCDGCWAADIDFGDYADVRYVLLRNGTPVLEHVDPRWLTSTGG